MDYNNHYYSNQSGYISPTISNRQHGDIHIQQQQQQQQQQHHHQQQQQPQSSGQLMQPPISSQNIRQNANQGSITHHSPIQQQIINYHPQQTPSPHQHPGYHQIQQHGHSLSHSASPILQHHNHQSPLSAPSPHVHSPSPHLHVGPTTHIPQQQQQQQQQQINQINRPSYLNHPQQTGMQRQQQSHNQNFFNNGNNSSSMSQSNLHHYPQTTNQNHPAHLSPHQQPSPIPHQQPSPIPHHHSHHSHTPVPSPHVQSNFSRNTPSLPPSGLQTEARILELFRKLQARPISKVPPSPLPNQPYDDSYWWEKFATEFFDNEATLTICIVEDKEVAFTIGRTLIPRFFRTYFDGGVTDISINLRNPKEIIHHNNIINFECDQAYVVTNNIWKNANPGAIIHTEGNLSIDFISNNYDNLLVKTWKFFTKGHREFLDRAILSTIGYANAMSEPVTRHGLTKATIAYLKMCMIIEPMQHIMSHFKQTNLLPKDCLRQYLAEKYKYISEDPRPAVVPTKRRKRKPASAKPATGNTTNKRSKVNPTNNMTSNNGMNNGSSNITNNVNMSPPRTQANFTLAPQDVMVVSETPMMGAEFGDDNERMITRLENTQYEEKNHSVTRSEDVSNMVQANRASDTNGLSNTNQTETEVEINSVSPIQKQQQQQSQKQNQKTPQRQNSKQNQPPNMTAQQETMNQSQPQGEVQSQSSQAATQVVQDQSTETPLISDEFGLINVMQFSPLQVEITLTKDPEHGENSAELKPELTSGGSTTTVDAAIQHEDDIALEEKKPMIEIREKVEPLAEPIVVVSKDQQTNIDEDIKQLTETTADTKAQQPITESASELNVEQQTGSNSTEHLENHTSSNQSVSEDRDDCRSTPTELQHTPKSSNNKSSVNSNGSHSSNKQNRRRSSERKETLREGLMRTSDFVVAMKDLKCEHPSLWRITTGNNLLQQFEPKAQNGVVLYENTNQYAGWNPEIKKDYVGVDVKLTQHTRNQITVERLLLNFQNLKDADSFYDKHFVIYLQILISTALDPKFWESIENEPEHHDYFLTSRRIVEDITKRFKHKLSNKLKLSEVSLKNVEKYPNLVIKQIEPTEDENNIICRACNTNPSTQILTFGNRSYDMHSYKSVKITSELTASDEKDLSHDLCDSCLEIVKLYSEVHHLGYRLYNLAREKVELHRTKGKPINAILDECIKDEEWLSMIYAERDTLWSKVENIE